MFLKLKSYLFLLISTVVAGLIAFTFGKEKGSNQVASKVKDKAIKDAEEVATIRVSTMKVHSDVQNEVISSSSSDVDRELLKWTRKDTSDSGSGH